MSGEKPQDLVDPTAYAWGRRSGRSGDLTTALKLEVSPCRGRSGRASS